MTRRAIAEPEPEQQTWDPTTPNPDQIPDNTTTQTTPGIPPEMTYKDGDEFEDGGKPATHKTADPIAVLGPKSQPDPIPPDPPEAIAPGGEEAAERMPNPPPLPDPSTFQNYPGSGHDDPLPEPKAVVLEEEEEEEEEKTEGDYIKLKEEDEDEDEKEEDGEGEEDDTEEGVEVAKKPTPAPVRKPASPPARRR